MHCFCIVYPCGANYFFNFNCYTFVGGYVVFFVFLFYNTYVYVHVCVYIPCTYSAKIVVVAFLLFYLFFIFSLSYYSWYLPGINIRLFRIYVWGLSLYVYWCVMHAYLATTVLQSPESTDCVFGVRCGTVLYICGCGWGGGQ
jgi:hypothetical protein